MNTRPPVALTIAGSDPSGGAGVQADLKTFHQHRVYGSSAITLITVQNTLGVSAVQCLDPALVRAQIDAVFDDLDVRAVKTGALGNAAIIRAVTDALIARPAVLVTVDPVMLSKNGNPLLEPAAVTALRDGLLARADLVTPNLPEAIALTGAHEIKSESAAIEIAHRLRALGAKAVLVKGGHGEGLESSDVLIDRDGAALVHGMPRIATKHTHGTGCTLSAAITAQLAHGAPLREAYLRARAFLQRAIASGPGCEGRGIGPVDHFAASEPYSDVGR